MAISHEVGSYCKCNFRFRQAFASLGDAASSAGRRLTLTQGDINSGASTQETLTEERGANDEEEEQEEQWAVNTLRQTIVPFRRWLSKAQLVELDGNASVTEQRCPSAVHIEMCQVFFCQFRVLITLQL